MMEFSGKAQVFLVVLVCVVVLIYSSVVQAGQMVLASCWDTTGSGMGKRVHKLLKKELLSKGADLISYRSYLKIARKKRMDRRALRPSSIKVLSAAMGIDAVATCRVKKTGSRFSMEFNLYGASGVKLFSRTRSNNKPWLRLGTVQRLAADLLMAVKNSLQAYGDGSDQIELVPLVPLVPLTEDKHEQTAKVEPKSVPKAKATLKTKPVSETNAALLSNGGKSPKTEIADTKSGMVKISKNSKKRERKKSLPVARKLIVHSDLALPEFPPGPVPALFVSLGASSHSRAGLSPRYEAGFYPGIRLDGGFFIGTFSNTPVLRDIGLGGKYDRAFGLKYSSEIRPEKLAATEQHWSVQLMYRLEIEKLVHKEVVTAPTVVARFGYGDSRSYIDKKFPDVLSVRYTYTYGALDLSLWLVRPLLSMSLSAGYIFDVWPSGSLAGNGRGFCVSVGVSLWLLKALRLQVSYEQIQFFLAERTLGSTSDRYQMVNMRLGWFYN